MTQRMTPYIDRIAPEHDRTSCSDTDPCNGRFSPEDRGGCYRCTLLNAVGDMDLCAPEHDKSSCSDTHVSNARVDAHDHAGCYRCSLLDAACELQGGTVAG